MHDGLVQILDDAVVRAVDMDADLGQVSGRPPSKPVSAMVRRPLSRAQVSARTMLGERPDDETAMRTSPGLDWDCKLIGEDVLVAHVVGDRGEQLDVGAQAQHARGRGR